jgi:transcriptional regulator with XRE-family HTH domain
MDPYITGQMIKTLREKNKMTQAELAHVLSVSDKTISKWETGKGYPDITLLDVLSQALNISMTELLLGMKIDNQNVAANMLKTHFYVCPVCGNVIHSTGGAMISCHGITLPALESEEMTDDLIELNLIEDEYFLKIRHPMTKKTTFHLWQLFHQIVFSLLNFILKVKHQQDLRHMVFNCCTIIVIKMVYL